LPVDTLASECPDRTLWRWREVPAFVVVKKPDINAYKIGSAIKNVRGRTVMYFEMVVREHRPPHPRLPADPG
jgi:hypothetical protein